MTRTQARTQATRDREAAEIAELCTRDASARFSQPDPRNEIWRTARTVYVSAAIDLASARSDGQFPNVLYIYSDRIYSPRFVEALEGLDEEALAERVHAAEAACARLPKGSARSLSVFLTALWARPVEVVHILLGLRQNEGHTWGLYGCSSPVTPTAVDDAGEALASLGGVRFSSPPPPPPHVDASGEARTCSPSGEDLEAARTCSPSSATPAPPDEGGEDLLVDAGEGSAPPPVEGGHSGP